jgi:hypothetical protein
MSEEVLLGVDAFLDELTSALGLALRPELSDPMWDVTGDDWIAQYRVNLLFDRLLGNCRGGKPDVSQLGSVRHLYLQYLTTSSEPLSDDKSE